MSTDPLRRADRHSETAEKLLREAGITGHAEKEALARLLTAAAAPARGSELSGEQAALAAFREARVSAGRAGSTGRHRAGRARGGLIGCVFGSRSLPSYGAGESPAREPVAAGARQGTLRPRTLRAAVLGVAAAAVGGVAAVAVATGVGHLPSMLGGGDGRTTGQSDAASRSPMLPSPGDGQAGGPSRDGGTSSPRSTGDQDGGGGEDGKWKDSPGEGPDDRRADDDVPGAYRPVPQSPFAAQDPPEESQDEVALCRRYSRGKPLSEEETARLAEAAGGKNEIKDYCADKLHERSTSSARTEESAPAGEGGSEPQLGRRRLRSQPADAARDAGVTKRQSVRNGSAGSARSSGKPSGAEPSGSGAGASGSGTSGVCAGKPASGRSGSASDRTTPGQAAGASSTARGQAAAALADMFPGAPPHAGAGSAGAVADAVPAAAPLGAALAAMVAPENSGWEVASLPPRLSPLTRLTSPSAPPLLATGA